MAKKFKVEGLKELERAIKKLEKLPQTVVTKAARKGAAIALKSARSNAPVDSGDLKKGIVLKGEKSRTKGKKVYDVVMDRNMNDVYVKVSKSGKRSYYPASQEYGFMTRDGGYVPGYRYMRKSIEVNESKITSTIVSEMSKQIDKL